MDVWDQPSLLCAQSPTCMHTWVHTHVHKTTHAGMEAQRSIIGTRTLSRRTIFGKGHHSVLGSTTSLNLRGLSAGPPLGLTLGQEDAVDTASRPPNWGFPLGSTLDFPGSPLAGRWLPQPHTQLRHEVVPPCSVPCLARLRSRFLVRTTLVSNCVMSSLCCFRWIRRAPLSFPGFRLSGFTSSGSTSPMAAGTQSSDSGRQRCHGGGCCLFTWAVTLPVTECGDISVLRSLSSIDSFYLNFSEPSAGEGLSRIGQAGKVQVPFWA